VPILYQNAIPVFADIDETYNMDPADVERKITDRTRAILVVHLFGNACDMDAMAAIARRHKLALIEDCSQAHATKYKGRYLGTIGDIGCFSLQQSKHMTTGDGGMTITNRDDLSERMALFRDKGWSRKPGWGARTYLFLAPNYRMTELQGAVGLAQVKKVRAVVEKRMELGNLLSESIRGITGLVPAPVTPGSEHSYWSYALRVDGWDPKTFASALSAEGVGCGAGYIGEPIFLCMEACCNKVTFGNSHHPFDGCHTSREYHYTRGLCPKTEDALKHMINLGINEQMNPQDVLDMAGAIRKVAEHLPRP
jgi:dTDP-4-amino-4,6-dideoxygalactose transaminase